MTNLLKLKDYVENNVPDRFLPRNKNYPPAGVAQSAAANETARHNHTTSGVAADHNPHHLEIEDDESVDLPGDELP